MAHEWSYTKSSIKYSLRIIWRQDMAAVFWQSSLDFNRIWRNLTALSVTWTTIDRYKLLQINNQTKQHQKSIWKDTYKAVVKRAEPSLLCSKIRGKRGGVRQRINDSKLNGKIKINLPSIFLTNTNRLYNKLDDLEPLVSSKQLRNCCCLAITETWLDSSFGWLN